MSKTDSPHPSADKRLSTRISGQLATFVDQMTGRDGLYETPSEYIRDLIRHHMQSVQQRERDEINALLAESIQADHYSDWQADDLKALEQIAKGDA